MDYIKLLSLQSEPFSNSPDPSFFYLSRTYQDCLQNLEISIRLRRGLNLVLGEIGTGKTTLSRALIQQFQSEADRFLFHLILDPSFKSESEFLYALIMGFGIPRPDKRSLFAYKEAIRQFLLTEGLQKGRVIVLIVDEGQKLNDVCLELLRDLLNFETNQFKLLQLIIMAQKEFHDKIKDKRNLTDRINTFHTIRPLDKIETQDMIQFRLRKAGWTQNRPLFSSKAMALIYEYSQGYPRKIITLCHHSLLFMLIRQADMVEPEMIEHAVSQLYEFQEDAHNTTKDTVSKGVVAPYVYHGRYAWKKITEFFSPKRLFNPVISAVLIFLLFLTLLWGTRHMNWTNPDLNTTDIEVPFPSTEMDSKSLPVQAYENKDSSDVDPYKTETANPISGPGQVPKPMFIAVTALEGDTVFKMARRVYNIDINRAILDQIRDANPHIPDLDLIVVGDRVFFPKLSFPHQEVLSPESFGVP